MAIHNFRTDAQQGIIDDAQDVAIGLKAPQATTYTKAESAITVETISEMQLLEAVAGMVAIVKDVLRGGIFNYDGTQSAVDNGGTIIDGWVRQYSGAIDVKWFGAVGDGTIDDSNAIQNCFNAVVDNSSILIEDGTFLIGTKDIQTLGYDTSNSTTGIFVRNKNNLSIRGNGKLIVDDYITPIQFVDCINLNISDIGVEGYGQSNGAWSGLNAETSCHLLRFGGGTVTSGGGLDDVNTNACLTVKVDGVRVEESTRYGISFETCENIEVTNSFSGTNDWSGISLWSTDRAIIKGNTIIDMNDHDTGGNSYGVSCSRNINSSYCNDVTIVNNYIEDTKWEGIDTHGGSNYVIADNIVKNGANGLLKRNAGIAIVSGSSASFSNVLVNNNVVYNTETAVETGIGIIVSGDTSTTRGDNVVVSNNICYGNRTEGIRIASIDNATISGNICHSNRRSGLYINYTFDVSITDNIFDGNGGHADVYDAGIYLSNGAVGNNRVQMRANTFVSKETANQVNGIYFSALGTITDITISDNIYEGMTTDVKQTSADSSEIRDDTNYDGVDYTDALAVGANPTAKLFYDGTIIGSTDNGDYTRHTNGDLICRQTSTTLSTTSNAGGNIFFSPANSFTFPVEFAAQPEITPFVDSTGGYIWGVLSANTLLVSGVQLRAMGDVATRTGYLGYIAKGRWK